MKKRILSLLLAIVTVVTALPLLIFTAMAEEPETVTYPTTTEEEYNALYVQEGLTLATDFFFANKHWGKKESNPMPVAPYAMDAYDAEEERWDITYDTDGVTELSRTLNADFKSACTTYFGSTTAATTVSARTWLLNTVWRKTGTTTAFSLSAFIFSISSSRL